MDARHDRSERFRPLPARISRLDELAVDLWWSWHSERAQVFRRLDYALWRATAHNPVRMLWRHVRRRSSRRRRADPRVPRALRPRDRRRSTPRAAARNTWWTQRIPAARRPDRSRTSPPSSRCISRCRSTPAASACSPAITARKPATSACRSSASASCTRRATSTSTSPPTAGRKRATSG